MLNQMSVKLLEGAAGPGYVIHVKMNPAYDEELVQAAKTAKPHVITVE